MDAAESVTSKMQWESCLKLKGEKVLLEKKGPLAADWSGGRGPPLGGTKVRVHPRAGPWVRSDSSEAALALGSLGS